ncbi:MAG: PEP-CTERM sorting domain-containing protein [Planctomycetes bacterium]|nr:PEP-CTERM sorting domain-containing protein [Planctomycetota bacterium]
MKRSITVTFPSLIAMILAAPTSFAVTMDFDFDPVGTIYGATAGHVPGQPVYSEDGILMTVEEFYLGGFTGFYEAEVGGAYQMAFPTTALSLDNISVKFHLTDVGFPVDYFSAEFAQFGPAINFSVNDGPVLELALMEDIPADVAPGITASVHDGLIELFPVGDVLQTVLVGGQELGIDTIQVTPEPGTLALLGVGVVSLIRRRRRTS